MAGKPCSALFIMAGMDIGGVQSGVMNFAKIIPQNEVKFDILTLTDEIGFHEEEFRKYGKIYHMPIMKVRGRLSCVIALLWNNMVLTIRLRRFLREHKYDVVHCKVLRYCAVAMEAAKACGVKVRVSQAHVDKPDNQHPFFSWYYSWCAKRIEKCATDKLAVSPGAVEYLYGRYGGRVIKNPTISLERLDPKKYNPLPHKEIRLIQVGTFSKRKNQCFSVEILKNLIEQGKKTTLTFIGYSLDEPLYINELNECISKYELSDFVTFLPKDTDIPKQLSESDYMLLPSVSEGLPNVVLEAQAMGVPCFLSDTVNPDTDCGLCTFLSLRAGAEKWANEIIKYRNENGTYKRYVDMSQWDNREVCKEYIKLWTREM